jgi:hypothetical protein
MYVICGLLRAFVRGRWVSRQSTVLCVAKPSWVVTCLIQRAIVTSRVCRLNTVSITHFLENQQLSVFAVCSRNNVMPFTFCTIRHSSPMASPSLVGVMQSPVGTPADHLPLEFLKEIPKIVQSCQLPCCPVCSENRGNCLAMWGYAGLTRPSRRFHPHRYPN